MLNPVSPRSSSSVARSFLSRNPGSAILLLVLIAVAAWLIAGMRTPARAAATQPAAGTPAASAAHDHAHDHDHDHAAHDHAAPRAGGPGLDGFVIRGVDTPKAPGSAAAAAPTSAAAARPRVLVSSYPLLQLLRPLCEGVAELDCLIPPDRSTHDVQFSPRQIAGIPKADLILLIGGPADTWLLEMLRTNRRAGTPIVATAEGVDIRPLLRAQDAEATQTLAPNAHIWMNPHHARRMSLCAADALATLRPASDLAFHKNLARNRAATIHRLAQLHSSLSAQLAPLSGKGIVVQHNAYDHFLAPYGLKTLAVVEQNEHQEPTAAHLVELMKLLRERRVPCVFVEPGAEPPSVRTLRRELGTRSVELDPLCAGDVHKRTYEEVMLNNAKALVNAMNSANAPRGEANTARSAPAR